MEAIKRYMLERIDKLSSALVIAQDSYRNMPKNSIAQESWAGRIQEVQGRLEELRTIYGKLSQL